MRLKGYLELLRLPHLAFGLPFAYVGALFATGGELDLWRFTFITLAVIGLRSASLTYNDIADRAIDSKNPRTAARPLVAGRASVKGAYIMVVIFSALFFLSAYMLNWYAFILSPLVWVLAMSYPYSKRLHPFPHLHLGLVLGLVVFGGAIGAMGAASASLWEALSYVPWAYMVAVTFWVSGFDTIYAISDMEIDRRIGVKSLPALLGRGGALAASATFFTIVVLGLVIAWKTYNLGPFSLLSTILISALMVYEMYLAIKGRYLEAFRVNLVIAPIISFGFLLDLFYPW